MSYQKRIGRAPHAHPSFGLATTKIKVFFCGSRAAYPIGKGQNYSQTTCLFQVEYFNNKKIVDLVEAPHKGVLAILDEACLNVGKVTDKVSNRFHFHMNYI